MSLLSSIKSWLWFSPVESWKAMRSSMRTMSPSEISGIVAAEITFQLLRLLGVVAIVSVTSATIQTLPNYYLRFALLATKLARKKPINEEELLSDAIDAINDAF